MAKSSSQGPDLQALKEQVSALVNQQSRNNQIQEIISILLNPKTTEQQLLTVLRLLKGKKGKNVEEKKAEDYFTIKNGEITLGRLPCDTATNRRYMEIEGQKFYKCMRSDGMLVDENGNIANGPGFLKDNNAIYVGLFKQGLFYGKIVVWYNDGNNEEREYNEGGRYVDKGICDGQGQKVFENGDKYVGHFKNSLFHGQGRYVSTKRGTFEGEFAEGVIKEGTFTFLNGNTLTSACLPRGPHGDGTYKWQGIQLPVVCEEGYIAKFILPNGEEKSEKKIRFTHGEEISNYLQTLSLLPNNEIGTLSEEE